MSPGVPRGGGVRLTSGSGHNGSRKASMSVGLRTLTTTSWVISNALPPAPDDCIPHGPGREMRGNTISVGCQLLDFQTHSKEKGEEEGGERTTFCWTTTQSTGSLPFLLSLKTTSWAPSADLRARESASVDTSR